MKKKSTNKTGEKILVTAALPYANGDIHIGHLVEYVQADIFVRFQKLFGKDCIYICASDTHGTPIEVNAKKLGIKPEQMIKEYHKKHQEDFAAFHIVFDNFYTTHSKENKELSEFFFKTLKDKGHIYKKEIEAIYCGECQRFLPDRFVKGTCPNCGAQSQYGDVCEECNLVLKGGDLIDPHCVICGKAPQKKKTRHYFFKLGDFTSQLKKWLNGNKKLQKEVKNYLNDWIKKGLKDWDITRDAPYFGFKIPGEQDKYFYVWLDAPIGYIASTKNLKKDWEDYWNSQLIHFIGKDIIYFHFLFWPAMLMGVGYHVPDDIVVHGFLTVNGAKMSKSRGTFLTAQDFLKLTRPDYLRFYYASHLSKKLQDINLDFAHFTANINNTLVANVGNFAYRTLSFAHKNYGNKVSTVGKNTKLIKQVQTHIRNIEKHVEVHNTKEALNEILKISSLGNAYFQHEEPWSDPKAKEGVVGLCVNLVRNISILLSPITPKFCADLQGLLREKDLTWEDISFEWKGNLKKPKILLEKIENLKLEEPFPLAMKVGQINSVEDHPDADSLYLIQVDLGEKEPKQVVAGLKNDFPPGELKGKKFVFVTNMKPKKIRGKESQAMILVAVDGEHVSLLQVEKAKVGDTVRCGALAEPTRQVKYEEFQTLDIRIDKGHVVYKRGIFTTDIEKISVNARDGARIH